MSQDVTASALFAACHARDWSLLCEEATAFFDLSIDRKVFAEICDHEFSKWVCAGHPLGARWSVPSWLCWAKNRLAAMGAFRTGGGHKSFPGWPRPFHFFFIHLEETEAMLRLLCRNETVEKGSKAPRNRLSQSNLAELTPITRTAAVGVVRGDDDE